MRLLSALFAFFWITVPCVCANPVQQPHVTAGLIAEAESIQPGKPFWVGLELAMEKGWHTYWKNPGDSGLATSIEWQLPAGFTASGIHWPAPKKIKMPPLVSYGYEDAVTLPVLITPPSTLKIGESVTLRAKASWLVCKDICLPGEADLELKLRVSDSPPPPEPASKMPSNASKLALARSRVPADERTWMQENQLTTSEKMMAEKKMPEKKSLYIYLLFAFAGGLILNLMPCVFPVLSLKALGLIHHSGKHPWELRAHGLAFALGVLVSFWFLASALLALRAAGEEIGWGFQLQNPLIVGFLALLLFALGLNLMGVFEFNLPFLAKAGVRAHGLAGSFWSGVLATIVATPCTAPFMGAALAFALVQPVCVSLLIFTALAFGLATPYLALSFFPRLFRLLPKPGAWMESFKQAMAFPLFAAVVWLVWVLTQQRGSLAALWILTAMLLIALAVWIYGRWGGVHRSTATRWLAGILSLLFFALGLSALWMIGTLPVSSSTEAHDSSASALSIAWQPYSVEKIEAWKKEGRVIFIDFTAAWCLTCQVNKQVVFNSERVRKRLKELDVVMVEADWTNRDAAITRALESYGRSGVPAYVLYGADGSYKLLPELLTPDLLLRELNEAAREP